jgi:glycosyltransferase involved in cell wall biosynthesis
MIPEEPRPVQASQENSEHRPLKILHVDPEVAWGGGEVQVSGLIQHLSLRGHANHLVCHPEGLLWKWALGTGIPAFPCRMRNEVDLRPVFSLKRLIDRHPYDVIHFHTKRAHALSAWLCWFAPQVMRVVTRRMDYPLKKNWYNRFLYNRCVDGVVAISRKIMDLLVEGGVDRRKIVLIPSGVDLNRFRPASESGVGRDPLTVGTVAALEKRKGHRFLLLAAAELKERNAPMRFVFSGDGPERGPLEKLVIELGLQEEVTFLGFVGDIPRFLETIDLFVLPSLYEGLGVSVLEAMASGKPVVASRVGGLPDLVEDGVTGLLVPPSDSRGLAEGLLRLASDRRVLAEMGRRGRERAERQFSMEAMAGKNEDYYHVLIGDRRRL